MVSRMIGAALLNTRVYQDVRDDPIATLQAFQIILLSSIALFVAGIIEYVDVVDIGGQIQLFTWSLSSAIAGWVTLSLLAYLIGRKLLARNIVFPSLLRTIGFAHMPGVFYILFIFFTGIWAVIINAIILVWVVVAIIVALRETLQVSSLTGFMMSAFGLFIILIIRDMAARALL